MTSSEQRLALQELRHRKPSVNVTELDKTSMSLDIFDDLRCSNVQTSKYMDALVARNRDLDAYTSMVAHDLKEPLAALILISNLITNISDLTSDQLKDYLQQIKSTAYDMDAIIKNLLFFAEVSKAEAPVEKVDMASVVADVCDRMRYRIKEYQAQIDLPELWPDSIGYAPWIKEVWANYLSNALKYGGQPPHVELGASAQPDGMIRFWARDNGPGISLEAQMRLFRPFDQIDRIGNSGNGLGLSIVLQIVEKLGGQVGFESELDKGSLFFFTLPAGPSTSE